MSSPALDLVGSLRTAFGAQGTSGAIAEPLLHAAKPVEPSASVPQAITAFLDVEVQARAAGTPEALRFVLVNALRRVVPFDTAILLEPTGRKQKSRLTWQATAASDVPAVDRDSGILRALETAVANHAATDRDGPSGPQEMRFTAADALSELGFPSALMLPVRGRDQQIRAMLVCFRSDRWQAQSTVLLAGMIDVFAHAWEGLEGRKQQADQFYRANWRRSRTALLALGALAATAGLMLPVPMQVYAPAEVVAASPALVTAPFDGIIADIHVQPGSTVSAGTLLASFADTKLRNDAELAQRNRDVAETKLFRLTQSATANRRDTADLAAAQAELNAAQAELTYAREMLARARILADRSGLVIFGAKSDWIGKPVQTGERIMEIVDPNKAELRIDVPLADSLPLAAGNAVKLYLDGDPLLTIRASVQRTSFRAQLTGERQLAFRTFAAFVPEQEPLRLGLRGIARISGPNVTLGFYLFRRPIAALRQRVGF